MQTWSRWRMALLGSAAVIVIAGATAGFSANSGPAAAQSAAPIQATNTGAPPSFADLVARVRPAVVSVTVRISQDRRDVHASHVEDPGNPMQHFAPPQLRRQRAPAGEVLIGLGSGFFISPDGYIVTNNHVVANGASVHVTLADGKSYAAKVVGTDPKTDLALLKVDLHDAPYVKFAKQEPRVGDWVVAVGNPYGLSQTVTAGIVSARGRDLGADTFDDYLQIDAPINKGNSGGPAFNAEGQVVGVNTAIVSPTGGSVGIGFDIPSTTVRNVIAQLKANGHVDHGFLGVQVQPLTPELAESMGLPTSQGVIVDTTEKGSAAEQAGLQAGDVVTAIDGKSVSDPDQFARTIGMMAPDHRITLSVLRHGRDQAVAVTLGRLPA